MLWSLMWECVSRAETSGAGSSYSVADFSFNFTIC